MTQAFDSLFAAASSRELSGDDPPQALLGFRTNEEWAELLAAADEAVTEMEALEDEDLRARVFALLDSVDAIHREALHRLVRLFKKGVLEQVVTDPAIGSLMEMYDLLPPKTPGCKTEWTFEAPKAAAVEATRPAPPPHWAPAPLTHELADGEARRLSMDDGDVLLCRTGERVFAADATCPHHGVTMVSARLHGFTLSCGAASGCAYDIRSGERMGGGETLTCHPVRRRGSGAVFIGFGVPFEPDLPAF